MIENTENIRKSARKLTKLITRGYESSGIYEQMMYHHACAIKGFFQEWDKVNPQYFTSERKKAIWQAAEFDDGEPDMDELYQYASEAVEAVRSEIYDYDDDDDYDDYDDKYDYDYE